MWGCSDLHAVSDLQNSRSMDGVICRMTMNSHRVTKERIEIACHFRRFLKQALLLKFGFLRESVKVTREGLGFLGVA